MALSRRCWPMQALIRPRAPSSAEPMTIWNQSEAKSTTLISVAKRNVSQKARSTAIAEKDYKAAFDGVEEVLRELIWDDKTWDAMDDAPDSKDAEKFRETLWQFVKNQHGLPPVSLNSEVWINTMKDRLATLISDLGVSPMLSVGKTIQKRGREDSQLALPLFGRTEAIPKHSARYDSSGQRREHRCGSRHWQCQVLEFGCQCRHRWREQRRTSTRLCGNDTGKAPTSFVPTEESLRQV